MKPNFNTISRGGDDVFVSGARVILGLFALVIGVMIFFVPEFRAAFNSQISSAGLRLSGLTQFVIPVLLCISGVMLVGGVLTRIACVAVILVTGLMTYLHLVVPAPSMFPQQFGLPLIPIIALVLSVFLYFVDGELEEEVI